MEKFEITKTYVKYSNCSIGYKTIGEYKILGSFDNYEDAKKLFDSIGLPIHALWVDDLKHGPTYTLISIWSVDFSKNEPIERVAIREKFFKGDWLI